jgi:uncharacterized membrane-anchored protein
MTLDQLKDLVVTVLDIGTPGVLVLLLYAMWKGWLVPKREVDDKVETITTQRKTIDLLETANDRLLDEIAKPLAEVLASLPPATPRNKR